MPHFTKEQLKRIEKKWRQAFGDGMLLKSINDDSAIVAAFTLDFGPHAMLTLNGVETRSPLILETRLSSELECSDAKGRVHRVNFLEIPLPEIQSHEKGVGTTVDLFTAELRRGLENVSGGKSNATSIFHSRLAYRLNQYPLALVSVSSTSVLPMDFTSVAQDCIKHVVRVTKKRLEEDEQKRRDAKKEISKLRETKGHLENQINVLERDIAKINSERIEDKQKKDRIEAKHAAAADELAALKAKLEETRKALRAAKKNKKKMSPLDVVLVTDDGVYKAAV